MHMSAMMNKLFPCILSLNLVLFLASALPQTAGEPSPSPAHPVDHALLPPLAKSLPPGIKLSDVVEAPKAGKAGGPPLKAAITVEQKLSDLKAVCNGENKLVDGTGKPIVFYHLIGCWGNPPPNYQELLQKQRSELEKLQQQYTVIEMTCNPSGVPIS
jgi:hypothetical protein